MLGSQAIEARQGWLAVLANAPLAGIEDCIARAAPLPAHTRLRGPEIGLIMVQGRAGGDGAPFNLGEMTVTRCTVRNAQGQIGHAYLAGRDPRRAELVAALDAALQHPTESAEWARTVVAPLAEAQKEARRKVAGEAAATRVDFFTLATMRS
ncbi:MULTISPECIES: phosphonate C-P lyase system protein PhnG [unclassified Acidisoma]|uniref:phosphonate C-P lyase system protein PhnG n=1 Tax=unclassified Acidisoma TaxID=2634065 RepID=UPI00352B6918